MSSHKLPRNRGTPLREEVLGKRTDFASRAVIVSETPELIAEVSGLSIEEAWKLFGSNSSSSKCSHDDEIQAFDC